MFLLTVSFGYKVIFLRFHTFSFATKLNTLWFLYLGVYVMILQKQGTQTIWWFCFLLLSSSSLLFSAYLKFKSVEDIKWERKTLKNDIWMDAQPFQISFWNALKWFSTVQKFFVYGFRKWSNSKRNILSFPSTLI